jgi:hypothetical protein
VARVLRTKNSTKDHPDKRNKPSHDHDRVKRVCRLCLACVRKVSDQLEGDDGANSGACSRDSLLRARGSKGTIFPQTLTAVPPRAVSRNKQTGFDKKHS